MTTGMRWRIMTLQAVLVLVLAMVAGFSFWASNFTTNYVHDELASQQIFFPGTDQVKAGGALDPAEFPASIRQYAGTQLDNGDKAKEYANNFIGKHLQGVAKDPVSGKVVLDSKGQTMTYATMGDYINTQKAAGASAATLATLNAERDTMFKGEMLRGALLNAWGWSQVGLYAGWAAIGFTVAAVAVAIAFLFELYVALALARKNEDTPVAQGTAASPA